MADVLSTADTTVGAGAFNKRIRIQQQSAGLTDGQGGQSSPTWTDVITGGTWAHIEPYKGQEVFRFQQVFPSKWAKILIRYRPSTAITSAMRVLYKSQIYNIRSVTVPAEAQTTIELLCEELQARGSI